MNYINKYLRNLSPYKLASHKIWDVDSAHRIDFLKLDWNEATIPPSPLVKERLKQLIDDGNFFHLYPSTHNAELCRRLAEYSGVSEDNVQYFGSSDALHEYIAKVYVSVGDPVLILGPSYDNFRLTCEAQGARIYYSLYSDDFTFNEDVFHKDILECRPAVVYICNPNNPTGNLHSEDFIKEMLETYPDSLFIIDEAYFEFTGYTVKNLINQYENLLVTRTMSKAFALANFRVGYLLASKQNIRTISKVRNPKNLSTCAQEAAIAVLSDLDYMKGYVNEVLRSKDWFCAAIHDHIADIKLYKGGGNFIMLQFKTTDERDVVYSYLEQNNIFVRLLSHSELLSRCLRITIGTREQMAVVYKVIKAFYDQK